MASPEDQLKFSTADDFGFSTLEISSIRALPEIKRDIQFVADSAEMSSQKLHDMYHAIVPLLDNLMKDADKNPYIHWPNRAEKIKAFKEKLIAIRDRE